MAKCDDKFEEMTLTSIQLSDTLLYEQTDGEGAVVRCISNCKHNIASVITTTKLMLFSMYSIYMVLNLLTNISQPKYNSTAWI